MYICSIKSIIIIIIETLACLSPGLPQHADQKQLLAHLWLSSICVHEYIWRNVWTSDKRCEPGTLSHSHMLSIFHSLIQSLSTMLNNFCFNVYAQSHSLIQSLLTCWTTFVFMSMFKSHSLSFTLSLSHSHSHTLSLFQSLIHSLSTCGTTFVSCLRSKFADYRWKCQWVFSWEPAPWHLK